jgi:DNA gyrase/topoisomerase IV subunit A
MRAISWHIDGLKPIQRRILLAVHEVARNKFVKSARIVGHTISCYSPHGDASTYDTMVSLVQLGYVKGQGNFGFNGLVDVSPAAYRYTEACTQKVLDDMFSEFLDFVPWEPLELDPEPLYLPSPVPIGLIGLDGLNSGISFNTTKVPRFTFKDLISRLLYLIDPNNNLKFIPKPQFKNCLVNEITPNAFEEIFTKGISTIQVIPNAEVKDNDLFIYGKNPLYGFSKLLSFLEKYEETNKQPYCNVIDLTEKEILKIRITPYRKKIDSDFINKIGSLLMCNVNVLCNFVNDDGSVSTYPLDTIILNSFNKWKEAWLKKNNHELGLLEKKLTELNAISIIRKILEDNPTVKTIDEIIKLYNNSYTVNNVSQDLIKEVCSKHRIKTLIEKEINIKEVEEEIKLLKNNIVNHDSIVLNRVNSLK